MDVTFLTPLAGLVALLVVVPLAVLVLTELRVGEVRRALRLPEPRAARPVAAIALLVLAALLGLGAAQPTLDTTKDRLGRTDVEVYFAFDTSRSMLAASRAGGETRFSRAQEAALRLRRAIPDLKVGVASVTDRTLPHLLPTVNRAAFNSTVARALGVDRPPPLQRYQGKASTFDALRALPTSSFFAAGTTRRLVVYLTDGESRVFNQQRMRNSFASNNTGLLVMRFWRDGERVFRPDGTAEPDYEADPESASAVEALASAVGGRAFDEDELDQVAAAIRNHVGEGEAKPVGEDDAHTSLAPYLFLGAFVPLGFLLWRRNF
jgi:hypothetical protein